MEEPAPRNFSRTFRQLIDRIFKKNLFQQIDFLKPGQSKKLLDARLSTIKYIDGSGVNYFFFSYRSR